VKFVLTYTTHDYGSVEDGVEALEAAQKLLSTWSPTPTVTIHQWVSRCDGNGGFSVIETDNAGDMFKDLSTWSPWLDFQVFPVIDISDATPLQQEAVETAKSVV
jgi:hypothetical protein